MLVITKYVQQLQKQEKSHNNYSIFYYIHYIHYIHYILYYCIITLCLYFIVIFEVFARIESNFEMSSHVSASQQCAWRARFQYFDGMSWWCDSHKAAGSIPNFMSNQTQPSEGRAARHNVPMQHVLLGPQWPTWWCVWDLWGRQRWMLLPAARHTDARSGLMCLQQPGRPPPCSSCCRKRTGCLWLQPPSSSGLLGCMCSHICRDF